jgi:hypothetical protein
MEAVSAGTRPVGFIHASADGLLNGIHHLVDRSMDEFKDMDFD